MWKYVVLALAAAAIAVIAFVARASPADERPRGVTTPRTHTTAELDRLDHALELVRDCRVRSTLSLHSGVFALQLKDGSRIDVPAAAERDVYAEIQRATKRCGSVVIAME